MSRWNEPDERDDSTGKLPDGETSYLSLLSKDTKLQVIGFVHIELYFAEKIAQYDLWARSLWTDNLWMRGKRKTADLEPELDPADPSIMTDRELVTLVRAMFPTCKEEVGNLDRRYKYCNASCPFHAKWSKRREEVSVAVREVI